LFGKIFIKTMYIASSPSLRERIEVRVGKQIYQLSAISYQLSAFS